jgi:hypothetical protein
MGSQDADGLTPICRRLDGAFAARPTRSAYSWAMLSDIAIYVDGKRSEDPGSLEEAYDVSRERGGLV